MKELQKTVLYIFLILGLVSCGNGGTETGNPDDDPADSSGLLRAITIVTSICSKLKTCHSDLSLEDCAIEIKRASNIDTEIGISAGSYSTFQDIIDADTDELITMNRSNTTSCLNEITALECAGPTISSAYDHSSPGDYQNIYLLFREGVSTTCPLMF